MFNWQRNIQTIRPLPNLPTLLEVSSETHRDTSYFHAGKDRQHQVHSLFKYCLKGEGVFRNAAGSHRITPGTAFLIKINDPETEYYFPQDAAEPWEFVYICFSGSAADLVLSDITTSFGHVFSLPITHDIISRILEFRGRDNRHCLIAASQGTRLINDLFLALIESKEETDKRAPGHLLVRHVREYVYDHMHENVTVSDIADTLQVSREYLSRCFRKETGIAPHDFAVRQKMLAACRLLKTSTMSCKEIASELGYDLPGHFNRSFSRVIGMAPGAFRRGGHPIPPN